jgi:hypothetical protein
MLKLGDRVRLRACRDSGEPGTVVRFDHGKLTVYWPDMDWWSRHPPDSLELAELAELQPEETEVRSESWRQSTDARSS